MIHNLHSNIAGIDVSKSNLDIAIHKSNKTLHVSYDPTGLRKLINFLNKHNTTLVILEATGHYHLRLINALNQHNIPFHIANPTHVRNLAKATGQFAKTDTIDAKIIALFGHFKKPQPTPMPSKNRLKLQEATRRYRQLKQQITQTKNQIDQYQAQDFIDSCSRVLDVLQEELAKIEQSIQQLVDQESDLKKRAARLQSVPGVGQTLAHHLVTSLPELGQCNRKQIAKLVGIAPLNKDSGRSQAYRKTAGGRRIIRTMMYMPTLSAIRHNPLIKTKYHQLLAVGKRPKVAIIACMRKLLTLLNYMIKAEKDWPQILQTT